ncbi:hypothetical protein BOX15_Mlig000404g1 [Macrostomum lignano]|uniref:ribonuclease Z n=1 Tax=Macrostomum lignano TaxID=282301 RepID=A0A267FAG9_9PLAT|nr:hypothetical protein BOX15_Mlig000404g1 [Macrostomum lignano]
MQRKFLHCFNQLACQNLLSLVVRQRPGLSFKLKRQVFVGPVDTAMAAIGSPIISTIFLSSGSVLSPQKSLVVVTAHNSYLINAPEGISRVLQESGTKFSKISHIFITGNQWDLCAGIIGTCLNISGAGLQSAVNLHGPPIVKEVNNLMSKFADSPGGMKIEYNASSDFADPVFQVASLSARCTASTAQSYCYLFKPNPLPAKLDMLKAVQMNFPVSMLKDGVTAKKLKAGESVELPDGRVIDGNELLIHPAQSKSILILDCATAEIAAQLALNDRLKSWICGASSADANCSAAEIDLVVHLAEPSVLRSNQYRAVIDLFRKSPLNSNAKHIVLDGQSRIPALYAAHQSQLMLNSLDSSIFPLLYGHRFMERQGDESKSPNNSGSATLSSSSSASAAASTNSESLADFPSSATSCAIFQEYLIRPPIGFNYQSTSVDRNIATAVAIATANSSAKCLAFTEAAMREKIFEDNEIHITRQEFNEKLLEFKADYGVRDDSDATTRCYPWLQFIGTASSNPSKYRNVSAILLHVSETTKILLDCGEGTLLQLMNFYGEADCQRVLKSIKAICVSHMHLDHQSGIFCLLKARHRAFAESGQSPSPCAFIGPRGFNRWLEFFSQHSGEDGMSDVAEAKDLQLFWLETFWGVTLHAEVAAQTRARFEKFVKNVLGLNKLTAIRVEHSTKVAAGFAIRGGGKSDHKDWKIVYSGDTVPCANLVEGGMDCDLLIHEATFQDGLESEARAKKHSTVGQALSQAAAMRAGLTILTHFSTRYTCSVPVLKLIDGKATSGCGFAYDHMCASLANGDLDRLPRLARMLPYVFPKHFAELGRRSYRIHERLGGGDQLLTDGGDGGEAAGSSGAARAVNRRANKRRHSQQRGD